MTAATPRDTQREIRIDGEAFVIPTGNQLTGARQWKAHLIGSQEVSAEQEQALAIDFVNGGGFTWQAPFPGCYENANGWDASSRGKTVTWPRYAAGATFESAPNHGWQVELGGYLYVCRGRYVQKYEIDQTQGSTWAIVSTHDLGSGITLPGRPWKWRGKLSVPHIDGSGVLQEFPGLTTQAAEVTEVQTISVTGTPTTGTFTVTFDGKTTAAFTLNDTGAAMQALLRTIAGLEQVTVVRSGAAPNYVYTVTMTGAPSALAGSSPPQMTSTESLDADGAVAHATTTPGTTDTWNEGPADRLARTFTVNAKGHLVAAMDDNEIRTCDDDALVSGDWAPNTTEGYTVGDSGSVINELGVLLKYVMVYKEDGAFSFDEDLYVQPELPDLQSVVDAQNGFGSSYTLGKILMPHRAGLVLWDLDSFMFVGPNQEDGLEGDLTQGWGRVAASDVYGKYAFVVANDSLNTKASLWSMQPGSDQGRAFLWHSHLLEDGLFEDVKVISVSNGVPVGAVTPTVSGNDATVGTIDWTDHANALDADDSFAYAGTGTSKYLLLTAPVPGVPDDATILGIRVRVRKQVA